MPLVTRPELTVTAAGDREIVLTRQFTAPRSLVFDAWTRPDLVARWFGRKGWTMPQCEIDLRVGGGYRYVMRGPDGLEIVMRGTYREIVRPERLVTTESFEGFQEAGWREEDETVNTIVLTEQDGVTTWTSTTRYPSEQVRDEALKLQPAWAGLSETMERLDEVLASAQGT